MTPAQVHAAMLARHTAECVRGQLDFEPCVCRPPAVVEPLNNGRTR